MAEHPAQHVLVFSDNQNIVYMLEAILEEEGYVVTSASSMDDALMVLRTSLHPLVVLVEHSVRLKSLVGAFFGAVRSHPEWYGQHRYLAICPYSLPADVEDLLETLHVRQLHIPFNIDPDLLPLVAEAAASIQKERTP